MAASKEEIQRGKSLMGDLVRDPVTHSLTEDEWESLVAVQRVLDVMESPLFTALVDIRDQCKKCVQESEKWNEAANVKAEDTADVVAQFKERYRISGPTTNSDGTGHSRDPSLTGSHFMDDTTITESAEGLSTTCEDYASTLNREHQRTPSVSSGGSCSSAGSRKRRGKKLGKAGGSKASVTLTRLAQCDTGEIPLRTLLSDEKPRHINSDISLSSLSSEPSPSLLPPSFSPSSHEDVFSPPGPVSPSRPVAKLVKEDEPEDDASDSQQPKDILFFMRDKKSMTDIRTTLSGNWGRGRREVRLHPPHHSIGLDLCGLSSTGVFVSGISDKELGERMQVADQILEVQGESVANMAWFEVQQLIEKSAVVCNKKWQDEKMQEGEITLVVQYNPAGMGEVKRQT